MRLLPSPEDASVGIVAGRGLGRGWWMAFQTGYAGSIPVARSTPDLHICSVITILFSLA
jgi:hypothetical protein